jgi:predicted permease
MLRNSPGFTTVAVASLALGIGANTAIFSLVDAILLRWLPVANPQELVVVARNPAAHQTSFSYPDYRYLRDHSQSYTGVIAFTEGGRPTSFALPGSPASSRLVAMAMVTGNYFEVLGVTPVAGRVFNSADNEKEGAHPYVVLSHRFWQNAFRADSGVIGRDILLNGARFQVVGVTREGFTGTAVGNSPDVFVPIVMARTFNPTMTYWNTRNMWWLTVIGRLKPGVSIERAAAEANVLWNRIIETDPNRRPVPAWDTEYKIRNTALVIPGSQGYSSLRRGTSKTLTVLSMTVALVLVIACANVANLLLARAFARRREVAIRLAVGAGRGRLIRQLLTESVGLAILGGVAGLVVAWFGVRFLVGFMPRQAFPIALDVSPDARVLGFAFGLSLLTGILFGLAPALRASRVDVAPTLKSDSSSDGRRPKRWTLQRGLVSFQIALSMLLLAGAALFVRTLVNLRNLDPGMNRENLLFVATNLTELGYQPQREREVLDRLRDQVQRLPGVRAAAFSNITPLGGSRWNSDVQVEGYTWRADERPLVDMNAVSPRYFEAAGIPIVLGRDFTQADSLAALPDRPAQPPPPNSELPDPPGPPRVAIVNEAFAKKFFGAQSPIGRRFVQGDKWEASKTWEIVGVVADARYFEIRKPVEPMIYQPQFRDPRGSASWGSLCVRTTGDPMQLVESIRRGLQEIDASIVIVFSRTMEDNLNSVLAQERFVATLGGFFGGVALLLASLGLYGVMSQAVTRRTREIGIRIALGAEARGVLAMVMRDAMLMIALGTIVGVTGALAVTRFAESMLFGVKPADPVTFAIVAAILLAMTALAGFVPARRATRIQPAVALRDE